MPRATASGATHSIAGFSSRTKGVLAQTLSSYWPAGCMFESACLENKPYVPVPDRFVSDCRAPLFDAPERVGTELQLL